MEKGIHFLAGKEGHGSLVLWKNEKLFTYDEIEYFRKTGKAHEKDLNLMLPVFSEAWVALQYAKKHNLKDVLIGLSSDQEHWSYILELAKRNNAQRIVINPCIDDTPHECALITYTFDTAASFSEIDSGMKSIVIEGQGGYDKDKLNK